MKITITFQGKEVNKNQILYLKNINKLFREKGFTTTSLETNLLLDFAENSIIAGGNTNVNFVNIFLATYYTIELEYTELSTFINIK
jgi:hypothetical protein